MTWKVDVYSLVWGIPVLMWTEEYASRFAAQQNAALVGIGPFGLLVGVLREPEREGNVIPIRRASK